MFRPDFKTEVTVNPDAHWKDVSLYREVGYSFTCLPPVGYPEETEVILELVKIDKRIRPLWLTKSLQRSNGGFEKHVFSCIAFQDLGAEFHHRFPPGKIDLPPNGIGAAGLKYWNPIFVTSILDGLEQKVMAEGCPPNKAEAAASKLRQHGAIGYYVPLASCVEEARYKLFMVKKRQNAGKSLVQIARDSMTENNQQIIKAAADIGSELAVHDKEEKLQRNPTIFQVGN